MKSQEIRIIFFGTPEFAIPSLETAYSLLTSHYSLVAVITAPDKPVGRKQVFTPSPVKRWAQEHSITVLEPDTLRSEEWQNKILALNGDIGIIAAYGKIIPQEIIKTPRYGILNVHPSLLPRWRGPSPIQHAILAGDKETGVTIMLTDKEMDHGPVLAQQNIPIEEGETAATLVKKLAELGAALLKKTLPKWIAGNITPQPQDHSRATLTKILTREDGRVDWRQSAEKIERKIRALHPWPGTFTEMKNAPPKEDFRPGRMRIGNTPRTEKLKIIKATVENTHHIPGLPGQIIETETGSFNVQCGKGILRLLTVQHEGKLPVNGEAFLRGHRDLIGISLE